ncbi:MAG: dihydrofolate reductase [Candidatus Pacearchaeota archaeon]
MTEIRIIVAVSENNVIGNNNEIPWNIPEDLKRFRNLTIGDGKNAVIMGRKTYDSIIKKIGHPLSNRKNIILTRNRYFIGDGIYVANTIDDVFNFAKDSIISYVIGGESVYREFLPYTLIIDITRVHKKFDGDAFFPNLNWNDWEKIYEENKGYYSFLRYVRKV